MSSQEVSVYKHRVHTGEYGAAPINKAATIELNGS